MPSLPFLFQPSWQLDQSEPPSWACRAGTMHSKQQRWWIYSDGAELTTAASRRQGQHWQPPPQCPAASARSGIGVLNRLGLGHESSYGSCCPAFVVDFVIVPACLFCFVLFSESGSPAFSVILWFPDFLSFCSYSDLHWLSFQYGTIFAFLR